MGSAGVVPRAVDPLHRVRRAPRRSLSLLPRPCRPHVFTRHPLRRRPRPPLRHVRLARGVDDRMVSGRAPEGSERLRLRVSPGRASEGVRCRTRGAACSSDLERRHLRERSGVRDAAPADARPSAARDAGVRRAHARRAAQGDSVVSEARRCERSRGSVGQLLRADTDCHRECRSRAPRAASSKSRSRP